MKKVLLGLLATSAVSMAAPTDLTQTPGSEKTVFDATQEGAIGISGSLTSTLPPVKYVVYASADNRATKEDVLALPDFILSQDENKAGFAGVVPKVYVERIAGGVGAETYAGLEPSEIVKYGISIPDYTALASLGQPSQGTYMISSTALISKKGLEEMIKSDSALTGYTIKSDGRFKSPNGNTLESNKIIKLSSPENGVIKVEAVKNANNSHQPYPTELETAFKNGKQISSSVKITVKVN